MVASSRYTSSIQIAIVSTARNGDVQERDLPGEISGETNNACILIDRSRRDMYIRSLCDTHGRTSFVEDHGLVGWSDTQMGL